MSSTTATRGSTVVIGPERPLTVGPSETALVSSSSSSSSIVIGRDEALHVTPLPRHAWDAKGWTLHPHHSRSAYQGLYEVTLRRTGQRRRFLGRLIETRTGIATYIADPPPEIKRHRRGACFALVDAPWFRVHWHRQPRSVDEAILYVETVLDEALNA